MSIYLEDDGDCTLRRGDIGVIVEISVSFLVYWLVEVAGLDRGEEGATKAVCEWTPDTVPEV